MEGPYIFKGKFNPMRLLPGLALAGIGIMYLAAVIQKYPNQSPVPMAVVTAGVELVAVIMLFFVFKLYKPLKVDEENIYYGDRIFAFDSIDKLLLCFDFGYSWTGSEGVVIKLKNGEDINIKIANYTNGRLFRKTGERIKQHIEKGVFKLDMNEIIPAIKAEKIHKSDLRNEHFTKFFAYLFLLPDFWAMGVGIVGLIVLLDWYDHEKIDTHSLLFLFALAQAFNFLLMPNYFLVSENYLVIKKRLFFWWPTIIPMKDIKRISVFSTGTGGSGIQILDSEYRLHAYRAGVMSTSSKLYRLINMVKAHAALEE